MDQIYLPKGRPPGFAVGDFVEVRPGRRRKKGFYTYNLRGLEPLKALIKDEIFDYFGEVDNVIIIGSFLEEGFGFEDVDVILVGGAKAEKGWGEHFQKKLGIKTHFICLSRKSLLRGLKTDPLFQMMLSKYVAKKREIFKFKNEFNYKLLDLHLLKSKSLMNNFEVLTGKEKYELVRNLMAIKLFLEERKLNKEVVDKEIEKTFRGKIVNRVKENLIEKEKFLKKFKKVYQQVFERIMKGLKNESKQK